MLRHFTAISLAALCCIAAPPARGQSCEPAWQPAGGLPGVDHWIYTTIAWDPDGEGPRGEVLVIGGKFKLAGNVEARNIATWDPVTGEWDNLAGGVNDEVTTLAISAHGDLLVGGEFTTAGGVDVNHLGRWDGNQWHGIAGGMNGPVTCLLPLPTGNIVAGGSFTTAGGHAANRIAMWNFERWHPLNEGMNFAPACLALMPGGDIVAGGGFTYVDGARMNGMARWTGRDWWPMGAGAYGGLPKSFAVLPGGDLVAVGSFQFMGGVAANRAARWDGAVWSPLGAGLNELATDVVALPSGDVVAAGEFTEAGGAPGADYIARWDGAEWHRVGDAAGAPLRGLSVFLDGRLAAAGNLRGPSSFPSGRFDGNAGIWDGERWTLPNGAFNDEVHEFAITPGGDLIARGWFTLAGGELAGGLAVHRDGRWQPLAKTTPRGMSALAVHPGGDIFTSTIYSGPSGLVYEVVRWDGAEWGAVAGQMSHEVKELLVTSSGELIAGGSFSMAGGVFANMVARWDGSSWRAMGEGLPSTVERLLELPGGEIIAYGRNAGWPNLPYIAQWDGAGWTMLHTSPGGASGAMAIGFSKTGELIAAIDPGSGRHTHLARWTGAEWIEFAGGIESQVTEIVALPSGDIVVGGWHFVAAGTLPVSNIARWDGARWHDMNGGADSRVNALAVLPSGELAVGGRFIRAGGHISPYFATWACPDEPCYADCDGSGDLTFFDFLCFQNLFAAMDPTADCDGDTAFTFFDFLCFQDSFAAGCP